MSERNFFAELKRRNVYKVAVTYAVVAWLLIQIATQVFPFFDIPNWAVRLVVLLLITGFPIALVLAWAFELTPQGIVRTEDVEPGQAPAARAKHTWLYVVIASAVLSIVVFYVGRYSARTAEMKSNANDTEKALNSIAVLPFDNMSSDKENAYFAAGIQDEILTKLAAVEGLKVISRASTEKYRSHPEDVRKVAGELGVRTLLEGSVQKVGDSAHINVQLIDATNDSHIWAQTYDRQLKDVFAVEGEVASRVALALEGKLLPATSAKIAAPPTKNPEAYDLFLRGIYAHDEWFRGAAEPNQAIDFMREAVARDPTFVGARARFAIYQAQKYASGLDISPELAASAKAAADEAMALDPDSSEALAAKGIIAMRIDQDYRSAVSYLEKARDRAPSADREWFILGLAYAYLGDFQRALEAAQRAGSLNPRSAHYLDTLAFEYAMLRRMPAALEVIARARALEPENWSVATRYSLFLLISGQLDAAAEVLHNIPNRINKTLDANVALNRWRLAMMRRDFNAAVSIANAMEDSAIPRFVGEKELLLGRAQEAIGAREEATKAFQLGCPKVRAAIQGGVHESHLHQRLARLLAALGDQAGAFDEINKAALSSSPERVEPASEGRGSNQTPGSSVLLVKAEVLTTLGRNDEAIAALSQLFAEEASGLDITPALLRLDPMWDPLRNDPRFQELCENKPQ